MTSTLTLSQAVHESNGRASYAQLWRTVLAGRLPAIQPSGPQGRYAITRGDLEQLLQPTRLDDELLTPDRAKK